MSDLEALLDEAVGTVPDRDIGPELSRRMDRRRRARKRMGTAVVAMVTLVAVLGVVVSSRATGEDTLRVVTPGPDPAEEGSGPGVEGEEPVFGFPAGRMGVTLLFDDGYDGIAALDLDRGLVGRRVVEGQGAGDQPDRLLLVGDSLVVGGPEVWATPLDGGRSVSLGNATIAVPGGGVGTVWLADWGNRIGDHALSVRLVDLTGRTLLEGSPPNFFELVGLGRDVVLRSDDGLTIWDVERRRARATIPGGRVVATTGERLVWCEADCRALRVRDAAGRTDETIVLPDEQTGLRVTSTAVSPDRSMLALAVTHPNGTPEITLVNLDKGTASVVGVPASSQQAHASVAWSPDGRRLFWAAPGESHTQIGLYNLGTGRRDAATVRLTAAYRMVAVSSALGRSFLPESAGVPTDCPGPTMMPSGRKGTCGFRVTPPFAPPEDPQRLCRAVGDLDKAREQDGDVVAAIAELRRALPRGYEDAAALFYYPYGGEVAPGGDSPQRAGQQLQRLFDDTCGKTPR